jgi:hypothetical protein
MPVCEHTIFKKGKIDLNQPLMALFNFTFANVSCWPFSVIRFS